MAHKIGTIIISCVDDFQFLEKLIPETLIFSSYISISIGDKRWNGEPEDHNKINNFIERFKSERVLFEIYDPIVARDFHLAKNMRKKEMIPEAYARYIALNNIPNNYELDYILYLDSDEVIEGVKFKYWLDSNEYKNYEVMKLACYWYWRLPTLRARDYIEDSIVFIKRKHCHSFIIFDDLARTFFYIAINGNKNRMIKGLDGNPMIHHYSWVRTQEQMLKKVKSWGHKNDFGDIEYKVNHEFSHGFNGTDFLKNLQYEQVDNIFNIII